MGEDLIDALQDALQEGRILREVNHNILTLVPRQNFHTMSLNAGPKLVVLLSTSILQKFFVVESDKCCLILSWKFIVDSPL